MPLISRKSGAAGIPPSGEARRNPLRLFGSLIKRSGVSFRLFYFAVALSICATAFGAAAIYYLLQLAQGLLVGSAPIVRTLPGWKLFLKLAAPAMQESAAGLAYLAVFTYLLALAKNFFSYASGVTVARMAYATQTQVRRLAIRTYLGSGKAFFDAQNVGRLQTITMAYPAQISSQLLSLHHAIANLFMFAMYLTIMCAISWKLTLVVAIALPMMNAGMGGIITRLRSESQAHQAAQSLLAGKIHDILSCIALVKAQASEGIELAAFDVMNADEAKKAAALTKRGRLVEPLEDMKMMTTMLVIAAAIGLLGHSGGMPSLAHIFIFFYLARQAIPSLNYVNTFRAGLARTAASIRTLDAIVKSRAVTSISEGTVEFRGLTRTIELKDVSFSYPQRSPALNNITFTVEKGTTVALVGPSGAGKTTIASLLMRLYECKPGTIFADGQDIREFSHASWLDRIAYAGQDALIFNDTIGYNLIYGKPGAGADEVAEALKKARLYDFVMGLPKKLDTVVGDRGIRLSGGERQRLALARALLRHAEIVILDEATSSLDSATEELVRQAIDETVRNKTGIVIAHRLSTIKHANKIVVMDRGRVVEQGALEELIAKKGLFYRLWSAQAFF